MIIFFPSVDPIPTEAQDRKDALSLETWLPASLPGLPVAAIELGGVVSKPLVCFWKSPIRKDLPRFSGSLWCPSLSLFSLILEGFKSLAFLGNLLGTTVGCFPWVCWRKGVLSADILLVRLLFVALNWSSFMFSCCCCCCCCLFSMVSIIIEKLPYYTHRSIQIRMPKPGIIITIARKRAFSPSTINCFDTACCRQTELSSTSCSITFREDYDPTPAAVDLLSVFDVYLYTVWEMRNSHKPCVCLVRELMRSLATRCKV